jgi:hypothetical protein
MKHQRIILALVLLLVAASPMLVQGAEKALSKPASSKAPDISDRDNDDVKAGVHHDENETSDHHEDNETADHHDNESVTGAMHEENKTAAHVDDDNDVDTTTDVDNSHTVNAGENVTITHCLDNSVVDLSISVIAVPAEGTNVTIIHTVAPPSGHMFTPLAGTPGPEC